MICRRHSPALVNREHILQYLSVEFILEMIRDV